jgi:hypothetical protein
MAPKAKGNPKSEDLSRTSSLEIVAVPDFSKSLWLVGGLATLRGQIKNAPLGKSSEASLKPNG